MSSRICWKLYFSINFHVYRQRDIFGLNGILWNEVIWNIKSIIINNEWTFTLIKKILVVSGMNKIQEQNNIMHIQLVYKIRWSWSRAALHAVLVWIRSVARASNKYLYYFVFAIQIWSTYLSFVHYFKISKITSN
jgi:hypothetical protein